MQQTLAKTQVFAPNIQQDILEETQEEQESIEDILHGISEETWGGKFLLEQDLILPATPAQAASQAPDQPTPRTRIKGTVKYPDPKGGPPIEAYIISKDFGKRGLKGAGVNSKGHFKTTVMPDAYSSCDAPLRQIDTSEEQEDAIYLWSIHQHGEQERTGEQFLFGDSALRISETLAINEDVLSRLSDERTRDMLHASLILDLIAIGCTPVPLDEEDEEQKKHYVIISLGVPAQDLKAPQTAQAANTLKGEFSIDQINIESGKTVTWHIEVVDVIVEAQTKGTLFATTRKLNAQPAISKKIITVIDIGGGDLYEYEFDLSGSLVSPPRRIGDGTIAVARPLAALIEDVYGLQISEIEAQEALYKKTIWKGGEEVDIAYLIEELRPRFSNFFTKLLITNRMLTTFLIFTGGGAALLEKEIRAKLLARSSQMKEGSDFLIMPESIAAVTNVIGLFALAYYKIRKRIREDVISYLDLLDQINQIETDVEQLRRKAIIRPDDQQRIFAFHESCQQLRELANRHSGQYYPEVQQQILALSKTRPQRQTR